MKGVWGVGGEGVRRGSEEKWWQGSREGVKRGVWRSEGER